MKTRIHNQLCKVNDKSVHLALLNDFRYDIEPFFFVRIWDGKHQYSFLSYHQEKNLLLRKSFDYDSRPIIGNRHNNYQWKEMTDEN